MRGVPKAASGWRFEPAVFGNGLTSVQPAHPIHCLAVQRLKARSQFQAVLGGDKVAATAHFVLHRCPLDRGTSGADPAPNGQKPKALMFASASVCLGAMVPKRWAKHAVTRNTIKRQIYNVSADFESALPQAAYVVRLRSGYDRAKFVSARSIALKVAVRYELLQLFSIATRGATANRSSDSAQ